MTGELEELLKLEHEQRYRPDCPTGRAIEEGEQDEPRE